MLILFFSLIFSNAYAQQTLNYNLHHEYESTRALGMGDTFSGIDDYNVLFANPAGLATIDGHEFNIGITAGASPDSIKFTKDVEQASKDGSTNAEKETNISNVITADYGKVFAARAPKLSFIYAHKGWGIAFIPVDLSVALIPNKLVGPAIDVTAYQDSTLAFGWAKRSKDKKFSWGFLGKAIYRGNIDKSLLALDVAEANGKILQDSDFKEGMTVDGDLGVQYSPFLDREHGFFKFANPTFAMVLHNTVNEGFFSNYHLYNKNSVKPEKIGRSLDVGSRWDLPSFGIFHPKIMIDERDIFQHDYTFIKGVHLGAELVYDAGYGLNGSLQAGYSEGYYTAGIGLQSAFIKLELVTYAEEYGTTSDKFADREYMAQFNLNF